MIKRLSLVLGAGLLAIGLGTTPAAAQSNCSNFSGGALLGTLGGAALGGFLGSQIGSGTGQLAFTGAGVLVGGLVGNQIGKALTCEDQHQVQNTTQRTLETQPSGTAVAWNNPDSGNRGTVTPTQTYQTANGTYCRNFEQTVTVNGRTETGTGTACRNANGGWDIQQ